MAGSAQANDGNPRPSNLEDLSDRPPPYPGVNTVETVPRNPPLEASPSQSDAETPSQRAPSAPAPMSRSYGGQIVLADLSGLLVGVVASQAAGNTAPVLLSWSLSSPIVHLFHGEPARAAGSLLLHLGLPILGAFAGVAAEDCSNSQVEFCGLGGALLGGAMGMVAATTLDAGVLARSSDVVPPPQAAHASSRTSVPALSIGRNGNLSVAWRGTF